MLIDDAKLKELSGKKTPLSETMTKGTNTITEINKLMGTANTFLEKIMSFRNAQPTGNFQAKIEKGVKQEMMTTQPQSQSQQIIIDEVIAMTELDEIIKKIPVEEMSKKSYKEKREMIKPFVVKFIRRSVKLG